MKKLSIVLILIFSVVCIWQFAILGSIPAVDSGASGGTASTSQADSRSSRDSTARRPLPALPQDPLSESGQLEYLRQVAALEGSDDRTRAIEEWARSLDSPQSLKAALDALLQAEGDERIALMNRFGPALLSQWGIIDPKDGLITWSGLDFTDQWSLDGRVPESLNSFELSVSPLPQPLLTAWGSSDFAGFMEEFTAPDSFFIDRDNQHTRLISRVAEIFRITSEHQPLDSAVSSLDSLTPRVSESLGLSMATLVPSLSTRVLNEAGGLDAALATARSMPRSPVQQSMVMDLEASRLYHSVARQDEAGGASAIQIDPAMAAEIRSSFEKAPLLAQAQFFSTLSFEHNDNRLDPVRNRLSRTLSENTGFLDFQRTLLEIHRDQGGFDDDSIGFRIPRGLRRPPANP